MRNNHHWHETKGSEPAPYNPIKRAEPYTKIIHNLPDDYETVKKRHRRGPSDVYLNEAVTYDIETTSYTDGLFKTCWMFCWQFYFRGHVYMGRTWDDFEWFLDKISEHFGNVKVAVYVHNLGFEFSFMRRFLKFHDVFSSRPLNPLRASYKNIEFRDSLSLAGLPLEKLPTKTKKLTGDFDYTKIRTHATPLTKEEIQYCINDVVVLKEYIESKLKDDTIASIPMTRTGYVRRDLTKRMSKVNLRHLRLTMEQYRRFEQLYQGGFTHASAHTVGMVLENVRSLDITSSYPTVMVVERFPMSQFYPVKEDRYEEALGKYCCLFRLKMTDVEARDVSPDNLISKSKCIEIDPYAVLNNGRVVEAEYLVVECNEVDLKWYKRFYKADFEISDLIAAIPDYLPKPFVEAVLYYYSEKTKYKGVKGKEDWYVLMKECVNALYGNCSMKPLREPIEVDDAGIWMTPDEVFRREGFGDVVLGRDVYYAKALSDYNESFARSIYYPWASWVTSYARQNLFELMWKVGPYDYHYCDTDSLKISNYAEHKKAFDAYNRKIVARIREVLIKRHIDPQLAVPVDPNGIKRPLGVFTDEGEYWQFKTLGAKRYLVEDLDGVVSTVAGVNKKKLSKYLSGQKDPFEAFSNHLVVPSEYSGKSLVTHITEEWEGLVTDYTGRDAYVYTRGGIHIESIPASLEMCSEFAAYLYLAQLEGSCTEVGPY